MVAQRIHEDELYIIWIIEGNKKGGNATGAPRLFINIIILFTSPGQSPAGGRRVCSRRR